ncbi:MAG: hypothetical protein WA517_20470 [Candidatus Acidiferrum sp.]
MSPTLRLTADLALGLAGRAIGAKRNQPLVLQLSTDDTLDSESVPQTANDQETGKDFSPPLSVMLSQYRSSVIWIAGSEPMEYLRVARFTNAAAASRRHVFLETSGASLRPRLHAFQPSSRFYFAIRFEGCSPSRGQRDSREGAFRAGLEALRMARLAGFCTCARLVLYPDATGEVEELLTEIHKLDVDGFLITPAARTPELAREAGRLRRRLSNRRWGLLSRLLDASASPAAARTPRNFERQPDPESQPNTFGEGVEAG